MNQNFYSKISLLLVLVIGSIITACCSPNIQKLEKNKNVEGLLKSLDNIEYRSDAKDALIRVGEPAVEPLIGMLNDDERDLRILAIESLGEIGDERAVEPLIEALNDEEWQMRKLIAQALGDLGDKKAVEPLIDVLLNDYYEGVRVAAAESLGEIGDERAIDSLIEALYDVDPDVRDQAEEALVQIGDPVVKAITDLLMEGNTHKSYAIVLDRLGWVPGTSEVAVYYWTAKGDLGQTAELGSIAIESLIEALKNGLPSERKEAAIALGNIGDKKAVEPLIESLGDEDLFVREAAAESLGKIGDARAVDPLVEALYDQQWGVGKAAAISLGEIGDQKAVEPLFELIKNNCKGFMGYKVCEAAAEALGKINKTSVDSLLASQIDNKYLTIALVEKYQDNPGNLVPYLRDEDTVYQVYPALLQLSEQKTIPALVTALDKFGTKDMAEDYLNCDHEELEETAKIWAHDHGYQIMEFGE